MGSVSRPVPPMPSMKPPPLPKEEGKDDEMYKSDVTSSIKEDVKTTRKRSDKKRTRPASINAFVRVQPNIYVVNCPAGGTGVR